jgi:hypothetical protein
MQTEAVIIDFKLSSVESVVFSNSDNGIMTGHHLQSQSTAVMGNV